MVSIDPVGCQPEIARSTCAKIGPGHKPTWGLSSVGERLLCKQGVRGSNPLASTTVDKIENLRD